MRCPNCGGYDTYNVLQRAIDEHKQGCIGLIFCLGLPFLLPFAIWAYIKQENELGEIHPYLYACRLCKKEWVQRPGEELPSTVRPDLIAMGEQRLREEEAEWQQRRQAAAAAWWLQQQNRNE